MSSSIYKKNEFVFHFQNIEVIFHISSSWIKIRLHTKNQLPRLPITKLRSSSWVAWKCLKSFCGVVVWWWCGGGVVWWANPLLCQSQLELMLSWAVTKIAPNISAWIEPGSSQLCF